MADVSVSSVQIINRADVIGGWSVFEKIKKTSYETTIGKMSQKQLYILGSILLSYFIIILLSFFFSTYADGKSALLKTRVNMDTSMTREQILNVEWLAIHQGCHQNWINNLWKAIMLPFIFMTDIVPFIIFYFNC